MRLLTERVKADRTFDPRKLYDGSGNTLVLSNITAWGLNAHFLTNGGGAIHWAEHTFPYGDVYALARGEPRAFVINETGGGYATLGYGLLSGDIAVCDATTGGAVDMVNSPIGDAKFHSIPAAFFCALSPESSRGLGVLQDTSEDGLNSVGVVKARLGDEGVIVIDRTYIGKPSKFEEALYKLQFRLQDSKPCAVMYDPEVMRESFPLIEVRWNDRPREYDKKSLDELVSNIARNTNGKRIVIFVGEESIRYEGIQDLTTQLSRLLKAPTIYTQIGVSAVSPNNEYAAGHVMLGYNDYALKLWKSLTTEDTIICVGFDPFEYCTNQEIVKANGVVITNYNKAYGTENGTFAHRFKGNYHHVKGDIALVVQELTRELRRQELHRPNLQIPKGLNEDKYVIPPKGFTNMQKFYSELARLMEPGTVYVADVCMGYKDFQRVNPRPLNDIVPIYTHQGSLMGKSGGELLGMRLARPDLHLIGVTGDGCMEYFGASLGRTANLGLVLFVLRNGTHGLVDWGLGKIKKYLPQERRHTNVPLNDYAGMAEKQGWRGAYLSPDRSNFEDIMKIANSIGQQSLLVQVEIHPEDDLGQNRRLEGLEKQGQKGIVTL